jgi:hypothetical protein
VAIHARLAAGAAMIATLRSWIAASSLAQAAMRYGVIRTARS